MFVEALAYSNVTYVEGVEMLNAQHVRAIGIHRIAGFAKAEVKYNAQNATAQANCLIKR